MTAFAPAPWLGVNHPAMDVVLRALADIGVCEDPPGSNRGPQVDAYNQAAGAPIGSYWCASAVGRWWRDAGWAVPPGYASCDHWMQWAKDHGRFSAVPVVGAAVLYGVPGDARHIGLIVRVSPLVLSVEGNTTVEGANFGASRNGVAVSLKEVTKADPVLGYVHPA